MNKQDEEKAKFYGLSNDLEENFHGELEEAFLSGCEYKEQQMIEKTVSWIESCFEFLNEVGGHHFKIDKFIENYRKTIEEN